MAERPLSGRRIVVTRPREQAGALAEGLERLGATVSIVPLVAVVPMEDTGELDAALKASSDYDWIVFTSVNGVAAVGERLRTLGDVRVAVVGPATAAAVRGLGVEPAFVPERFVADEIAAGLEPAEGSRVLLPQADVADPRLAAQLRSRGAIVDAIAAYRTVEVDPTLSGVVEIRRADAVVLASGSAARSLARVEDAAWRGVVLCIGPATAEVTREVGIEVRLVAEEATSEGIIQALVAHYQGLS